MEEEIFEKNLNTAIQRFKNLSKQVPKNDYEISSYYKSIYSGIKELKELNSKLEVGCEDFNELNELVKRVGESIDLYYVNIDEDEIEK